MTWGRWLVDVWLPAASALLSASAVVDGVRDGNAQVIGLAIGATCWAVVALAKGTTVWRLEGNCR